MNSIVKIPFSIFDYAHVARAHLNYTKGVLKKLLSEQKNLRIPCQVRLARFTRIKNLLGQGVLFQI